MAKKTRWSSITRHIIVACLVAAGVLVALFTYVAGKNATARGQAWLAKPIGFDRAVGVSNEIWETKSYGLEQQLDPNDLSDLTGAELNRMLENVGDRRGAAVFDTSIPAASAHSLGSGQTAVLAEYKSGHVLFFVKGEFILVEYRQVCGPERTYLSNPYFMRKVGHNLLISFRYDGRRKATLEQLGLPNEPPTCRWTERAGK